MNAEIRELLPLYALNALIPSEHARLEAHVKTCAECQVELRELQELCGDLSIVSAAAAPAGLRGKLIGQIDDLEDPGRESLPLFALHALEGVANIRLETHLESCTRCREELSGFHEVCGDLAELTTAEPRASLRARLLARAEETKPKRAMVIDTGGILLARSEEIPWRQMMPGVEGKILSRDRERGYFTQVVRIAPGGIYPGHKHNDIEEIFILSGDLHIEGIAATAGDYCRAEPSSVHRQAYSINGCVFLVLASQHDEFVS